MEDGFEEHLAGMMDYRTEPSAPVSVARVRAGALRHSRMRTIGTAGSALAVAAVGIGVATVSGSGGHGAAAGPGLSAGVGGGVTPAAASSPPVTAGSPSPGALTSTSTSTSTSTDASPTAPQPGTAVRVASGTTITVMDGFSVRVTDTEVCYTANWLLTGHPAGSPDSSACIDTADPNISRRPGTPPGMTSYSLEKGAMIGAFQGPQNPVRVDAVMLGKHYPATLVSTPGMKNWIAVYIRLPAVPAGMYGSPGFEAYDASGHVIASQPDRIKVIPAKPGNGK